ncbi:hypothetical protein PVK06_026891 [Gossypium arboreum]|uniref:RNase H type-1 domain-containing protein n=1 Tax=Gossypium arboreum TaxID=29729 RepID=A0ABR0NZ66_GOSAR|nr:hypothetical protein PVK06_026891 [Gossypium arboreum]
MVWFHNHYGFFSSKWALVLTDSFERQFGSLKPFQKLGFAWRMGHELLPTNAKISFIRQNFRSDCPSLANRVKKRREDITIIGYRIKEILKTMEMFNNAAVNWIYRSCNKVVDFICKYAIINDCTLVFGMDYLKEIHDLVIDDSIN